MSTRDRRTLARATTIARGFVGITGPVQLLLGVTFWTGHALTYVPLHMAIGLSFVLAVATLGVLARVARLGTASMLLGVGGAALLLYVGVMHARWLPGPRHWMVQVLHLLVAIAAMGVSNVLAKRIRLTLAAHATREGVATAKAA